MPVIETRALSVSQPSYVESSLPLGTDPDEHRWAPVVSRFRPRQDLPPLDQINQAKIGRFTYIKNPVGHRLVELLRDYVIGGDVGVRIMARNQQVQEVLDAHWLDPANDWPRRLPEDVLDLSQDGELFLPVEVSEGRCFVGKLDPTLIKRVEVDPFNVRHAREIAYPSNDSSSDDHVFKPVRLDRDPDSKSYRRRVGDCFFWSINRPSGGTRGISDLFCLADLIDELDRFLFARARNAELRNYHMWDVTLTGAGPSKITEFLNEVAQNPPSEGGVRAHNELVKWDSVRPDTQAEEAAREAELLFSYILFGFGIPPTASGVISTGRTALSEQIDLLYKTFASRAREIKAMLHDLLAYVVDQAILAGLLDPDVDTSFRIILPRIALRDIQRTGGALSRVGDFFTNMSKLGVYEKEEVRQMLDVFLAALGFDIPDLRGPLTDNEPSTA